MAGSAFDLEKVQDERRDVPEIPKLECFLGRITGYEAECRIPRMTRAHVLDVAVVAGHEQKDRGVERVEQAVQEPIDPLQSLDCTGHPTAMTGSVGRVVRVERQVMIAGNAREIRAGFRRGDVGQPVVAEVGLPCVVHDLAGDRVALAETLFVSVQKPGTPGRERWTRNPTASTRTWPSSRIGVGKRRPTATLDDATQDVAFFDEGTKPGGRPRPEVSAVQFGGVDTREQCCLTRTALRHARYVEPRVEREDG